VPDDPVVPDAQAAPSYAQLAAALNVAGARIAQLETINTELAARVAELEARLGADSSNSSTPPSVEGLGKKPATPRRGGGRRGKQPGDAGRRLAQVADPDEVIEHLPERCGGCGDELGDAEVAGTAARQVFDIPPLRLRTVEHRALRRRCGCGHVTPSRRSRLRRPRRRAMAPGCAR